MTAETPESRTAARPSPAAEDDAGSLDGRVIAIAGAGGALGPVVARAVAARGATVAVAGRTEGSLKEIEAELGLPPERFDRTAVDLLDEEATAGWHDRLLGRFGRVDCLLHLVGGWKGGTAIAETSMEEYEWLHDLLVRTVQRTTQAFRDTLAESGHGRFVLISSRQAQQPQSTNASYAATKAAAEAWTLALADDLAGTGATANIVVVNAILTARMRAESPDRDYSALAPTEDIAAAIVLLCSDHGTTINGQRISLHGNT